MIGKLNAQLFCIYNWFHERPSLTLRVSRLWYSQGSYFLDIIGMER